MAEDISALDALNGGGGAAEAAAISFLRVEGDPADETSLAGGSLICHVVVINYRKPGAAVFSDTYVYEAISPVPTPAGSSPGSRLLNNYVYAARALTVVIKGHNFSCSGVYYCQQNSQTHVCAHASLRMALNTLNGPGHRLTSAQINHMLNVQPPCAGLSIQQLKTVVENGGRHYALIIPCGPLPPPVYVSILASIIESGHLALLVFTTGLGAEHVVTVFGHTVNSDQWHPEAIPAYSGPSSARYYLSSAWVSHFLIHDDNFGPYYTLSSRALDSDQNVKASWIIGILPKKVTLPPHVAQIIASGALSNNLSSFAPLTRGRWFDYVTTKSCQYVLRTVLIEKSDYIAHLSSSVGHDGSKIHPSELQTLIGLPDTFWMVEFTLPALYTGNRSKLGEVLVRDVHPPDTSSVLAIRLPSQIVAPVPNGGYLSSACALTSHIPVFRPVSHENEW